MELLLNSDIGLSQDGGTRPCLDRLPRTALLQIWKHLEFSQLRNAARSCRRLHSQARALPLRNIGAPMVVSALLEHRMQDNPGAEAALQRFWARRKLLFIVYILLVLVAPPVLLLISPPYLWDLDVGDNVEDDQVNVFLMFSITYACLFLAWFIAARTPLGTSRGRLYFQLRASEEYYTDSQWKMVRLIWLSFSSAALFFPALCIDNILSAFIGLLSPVLAAVGGVVAVRREFPPSPLRRSICLQVCHASILIFFVLCSAASHWNDLQDGLSHLGYLSGGFWAAMTAMMMPKVIRQLQQQTTNTWQSDPVRARSAAAFAARRHRQLRYILYASRVAVLWVGAASIFMLFRKPPPALLVALPLVAAALFGSTLLLCSIWRS